MDNTNLDGIVEVSECGWMGVNQYLEHGYRLLAIIQTVKPATNRGNNNQWYIRRGAGYVVGRTAGVAHFLPVHSPPPAVEEPAPA